MIRFDVITILPGVFHEYLAESILKRAQKKKLIQIAVYDLRDMTRDRHHTVDDRPYGGGAGMVLRADIMVRAILKALRVSARTTLSAFRALKRKKNIRVIMLSPRGAALTQQHVRRLVRYKRIVLLSGRYEGVDERVMPLVDEMISVGDYVLTGGELPALTIIDVISRLVPGVLGKEESYQHESHSTTGYLEHPHYTRPEAVGLFGKTYRVPKVLLSGDHKRIVEWRAKHAHKAFVQD